MADNAAAFAALQAQIDGLRRLEGLPQACALPLAEALLEGASKRIAAGVAPSGATWQPRADGGRPLRNAAKALTASASGATALLRLSGPEAKHHRGSARGRVRRPIVPSRTDLADVALALKRVAGEQFDRLMAGGKAAE